jgi:hypothetical protein
MQRYYSDYYFIYENCSYNLLWFIDLARDKLNLIDKFNYIVVPIDIIKELKREKLIDSSTLRASKMTKIKSLYQVIPHKDMALKFLRDKNISIINSLFIDEQRDIVDLAISLESNLSILKYRTKLGISKPQKIAKTDPTKITPPSKLNITISNQNRLFYGFRVNYHDISDIDYDFNLGKYISFFDIQMINNRLESIDFINIDSLSTIDRLYQPISWGLEIGYRDRFFIEGRVGSSFSVSDFLIFYQPTIKFSNHIDIDYKTGFLKSKNKFKFGIIRDKEFDTFITYQFSKNKALNIRVNRNFYFLSLFYYY